MGGRIMNKKLKIILCVICVTLCSLLIVTYNLINQPKQINAIGNRVSFLSQGWSDTKMKQTADIIAKGKVVKINEKVKKNIEAQDVEGKKFQIEGVSTISYEVVLNDSIKNIKNEKEIVITMLDGSSLNIEAGKEYLFYLYKNVKAPEHVYSLVSYDKGVFEVVNDEVNIGTQNKIKYTDLKDKIIKD